MIHAERFNSVRFLKQTTELRICYVPDTWIFINNTSRKLWFWSVVCKSVHWLAQHQKTTTKQQPTIHQIVFKDVYFKNPCLSGLDTWPETLVVIVSCNESLFLEIQLGHRVYQGWSDLFPHVSNLSFPGGRKVFLLKYLIIKCEYL